MGKGKEDTNTLFKSSVTLSTAQSQTWGGCRFQVVITELSTGSSGTSSTSENI